MNNYFLEKNKHSNTLMTSRFTLANASRNDDQRRMEDSLRDDKSLIGGGGGNALTTTLISLTSPFVFSAPPITQNTNTSHNHNDINEYKWYLLFSHSNPNGLNSAAMNSMTNNILQNKSSIENRNEAYKR